MTETIQTQVEALDVALVQRDFPVLSRRVYGHPLVYLDNAATSQKPVSVIEGLDRYYRESNANVHRGVHTLSEEATAMHEEARRKVARFINAGSSKQVIYTRNTTEAINIIAYAWGQANLSPGDRVVSTEMEHHSNIVPWQLVTQSTGSELAWIPFDSEGQLQLDLLDRYLADGNTRLVTVTAASNVLGTINPVREIVDKAHDAGALVLVDAAQSVPHMPVDVQELDCDFLTFSGHKMMGPTGIGILYGKRNLLEAMPPFLGGGDMIREVRLDGSTWNDLPWKFEAGTPAIAEAIGLGLAIDYLRQLGMEQVRAHEIELVTYAWERLAEIPDLEMLGPPPPDRSGLIAFTLGDIHPHDLAAILDHDGIAIRAGHHCAAPAHQKLGIVASARCSFYVYNTQEEVDLLVASLYRAKEVFTF